METLGPHCISSIFFVCHFEQCHPEPAEGPSRCDTCLPSMKNLCHQCSAPFETTKDDFAFYEKVSPVIAGKRYDIPAPTLCPDCRQQRRLAFRNERHLYHRKCDLTGRQIVSNFRPESKNPVYELHAWFGDKWDPRTYGRPFDFTRPFFEQYAELFDAVPQLSLSVWNSENSDFCNYIGHVKNSYLIFGSVYSEDCYYGSPYYSKQCVDTLVVRECEWCYECVDCRKLYECFYCQDCHSSSNLVHCFDLQGCNDCIGCAGLRNKKFHIFNEPYSEAQFRKMKTELDLCVPPILEQLQSQLRKLSLRIPHRYMQSNQVEDVSGNYVYECQRVHDSFYADRSQDCRYCAQVVDLKDCYDNNYTEENELCWEYLGAYQNSRLCFCKFCNQVSDALYCDACHASYHLFGCIGIRRGKYCILNKEYPKEEYEELVPKIIDHMQHTGEFGEFFPVTVSPFGYNETVAQEYFPLEKKDAAKRKWKWYEEETAAEKYLGPPPEVPSDIDSVSDEICEQILTCEQTGKLYKIIPQELAFYRKMHLPIPRECPNERHRRRLSMRNPRKLWTRECAKCRKTIATSFAPDRPEIVYCDDCYLSTVY